MSRLLCCILIGLIAPSQAIAQDSAQDLAKQLANPIASLISVPLQLNYDSGFGADGEGDRWTLNIQPVVPIALNKEWNLISRTILPVIAQDGVVTPGSDEFGLGDTVQSIFFSPREIGESGIIWGAGPAFVLPTATDHRLGGEKWGIGPTGVVLKQAGQITYGVLANQIWSIAGADDRGDISQLFVQPFISYTNGNATTFGMNSEISYNWISDQASIPINLTVSQLTAIGGQPVQIGGGARVYLERPENGPDWGLRFNLTFLFPAGG